MIVSDLSAKDPAYCQPEQSLASAAHLMQTRDCGMLPVVDPSRRLLGVITDRDLCLALATRDHRPSAILVRDVMSSPVHALHAADTVGHALKAMRKYRVRRLPVVDGEGRLAGILALNDLILAVGRPKAPDAEEVMLALKAVCAHAPTKAPDHALA